MGALQPHSQHSYGWAVDIRTRAPGYSYPDCIDAPSIYTETELRTLKVVLSDHFSYFEHTGTGGDHFCPHLHCTLRSKER